jgi:hypothetical protein
VRRDRDELIGAPRVGLQASLPGVAMSPRLPASALKEFTLGVGKLGVGPPLRSVLGHPCEIGAETKCEFAATANPVEHLQLGAVQMRDDGQVWCDPRQRLVLRREVMKVRDRRLRSPALGKEPLPGGNLLLRLSIVERGEESIGRSHPILERWMQRDLSDHRVVPTLERLQRRCEVGRRKVESGEERGCVRDRPRLAE